MSVSLYAEHDGRCGWGSFNETFRFGWGIEAGAVFEENFGSGITLVLDHKWLSQAYTASSVFYVVVLLPRHISKWRFRIDFVQAEHH